MEAGGDNMANMLPALGQNVAAHLRGSLEVEVGGLTVKSPQNQECLLTDAETMSVQ